MRAALGSLSLFEPGSLDEALRVLAEQAPVIPMAGCTDLYVALESGLVPGPSYINIWGLSELRGIELRGELLRIGALTTYTELIESALVGERLPILAAAAREVGGAQIQNRGTVGGNIANASPAGDSLPVLAVAEAEVVLASTAGERRVPFTSFYTGYKRSVRRDDELIVAVEIPPIEGQLWFRKVGTRAAQAISKVVMAAARGSSPRISLGSVAATVVRLPATEACLAGGGSLDQACDALAGEIQPIDDLRSSAAYRLRVAQNLLRRFWTETA
ncbi:FAD binding domain-containing protein [Haliangium sp.]|uniref:FAD binding domain-containing protein n=1 Tax=Haliangium sp. TaxID=2663208 RepID=UPI003D11A13A